MLLLIFMLKNRKNSILVCGGKVTPPYVNICVGMEESKCQATTQNIQRK